MTKATLEAVHPVLPSRDVAASIRYYVEKLGFSLRFQSSAENPDYAGIERGNVGLHLQQHDPAELDRAGQPSLRFVVMDTDALLEEYKEAGVFHEQTKLRNTDWGTREFAFFDPDNNGLTFYRPL